MRIQEYSDEYKAGIAELILPIQQVEFSIPISLEDQPDLADITGFYQHGLGNFWVALVNDLVVGSISLLDIGGDCVALRKMFVKKQFRGKEHQVAFGLLMVAQNWAENKGVNMIYLGTTEKFLAAHRFYQKQGYSEITEEHLPSGFPIMAVDKKFYMKKLKTDFVECV